MRTLVGALAAVVAFLAGLALAGYGVLLIVAIPASDTATGLLLAWGLTLLVLGLGIWAGILYLAARGRG